MKKASNDSYFAGFAGRWIYIEIKNGTLKIRVDVEKDQLTSAKCVDHLQDYSHRSVLNLRTSRN